MLVLTLAFDILVDTERHALKHVKRECQTIWHSHGRRECQKKMSKESVRPSDTRLSDTLFWHSFLTLSSSMSVLILAPETHFRPARGNRGTLLKEIVWHSSSTHGSNRPTVLIESVNESVITAEHLLGLQSSHFYTHIYTYTYKYTHVCTYTCKYTFAPRCVCLAYSHHTLIERNHPLRGSFLFTMFPDQEPCVRDFTTRCDRRIHTYTHIHIYVYTHIYTYTPKYTHICTNTYTCIFAPHQCVVRCCVHIQPHCTPTLHTHPVYMAGSFFPPLRGRL